MDETKHLFNTRKNTVTPENQTDKKRTETVRVRLRLFWCSANTLHLGWCLLLPSEIRFFLSMSRIFSLFFCLIEFGSPMVLSGDVRYSSKCDGDLTLEALNLFMKTLEAKGFISSC